MIFVFVNKYIKEKHVFMLYRAQFKQLENHDGKLYEVDLITNNDDTQTTEIKLSFNSPVIIRTESDGLFTPIKSRSCTISIITDEIIDDLYTGENHGVFVQVINKTDNIIIFEGFLTPCAYSQPYAKIEDILELEAVDCLSTLKNIPYSKISNTKTIKSVQEILYTIFQAAGYSGDLYIMYDSLEGNDIANLYLMESNFYDDDAEQESWKCYDVLEQICLFFGISVVPYKNNLYLIDYETLQKSDSYNNWRKISNAFSSQVVILDNNLKTITKYDYASNDTNISYDDLYNKISINDSIYELDEITTDIFDSDSRDLINNAADIQGSSRFIHTTKDKEDKSWTVYYTTYKFTTGSNWKNHFYSVDTFQEVDNYRNGNFDLDYGPTDGPNGWGNTIFAMAERFWIFDDYAEMTSSVNSKEVIAFNEITYNKRQTLSTLSDALDYWDNVENLPVLEYEFPEEIQWKANNGYSFICFKGDLWWQCDENKTEVWYNDFYVVYPFDGISTMAGDYWKILRSHDDPDYNKGWEVLQAKLQIGDYYWNGSTWTTTETTFFINYHEKMMPLNSEETEYIKYGTWNHPVYNTVVNSNSVYFSEFDKAKLIGEDCLAIPINENLCGKLKFTLYPPRMIIQSNPGTQGELNKNSISPVVYMKDFELSYKFVPDNYNTFNIDDYKTDSDIIYTNVINENYVTDFDEIELKINTAAEDKPISKSYIMNSSKLYVVNITKNGVTKRQEHNLVNMYYDHYNSKKKIYECTIHDYLNPGSPVELTATTGYFIIDTQSYDIKLNHNTVKLIEY